MPLSSWSYHVCGMFSPLRAVVRSVYLHSATGGLLLGAGLGWLAGLVGTGEASH